MNLKNIKKGKLAMIPTIGIACICLVAVMFMQFKIVNQTDITSIETMREAELTTELATWKEKYEETNQKYEETMTKINEYKNSSASDQESAKLLQDELAQVNLELGKTDVTGQGIVITLEDPENSELSNIKADNLLAIVNALKQAGAEAISINEQRIINTTDIVYINSSSSFVKINQQRVLAPYVIKAIGNKTYLESALVGNGGSVDELRKLGYTATIESSDAIQIIKYADEITSKYME